jgi:apolipoprotein N-acyltransferase
VSEDLILHSTFNSNGVRIMLRNFRDKIALSGVTVLIIGVALLVFTFVSAYGFLTESLSIIASEDLMQTFGAALAPLIATCIRIMYLGVMGWIGSLLTIRGITIIAHAPKTQRIVQQKRVLTKLAPQKEKVKQPKEKTKPKKPKVEQPKEETKTPEPEIVVIPPEQASQVQPQPSQEQRQENNSSQQPSNS